MFLKEGVFMDDRLGKTNEIGVPAKRGPGRPPKGPGEPKTTYESRCRAGKRSRCGVCDVCKEYDKWERIFDEKFADPHYYKQGIRVPFAMSSLARPCK